MPSGHQGNYTSLTDVTAADVFAQLPGVKPQGYFTAWPEYFQVLLATDEFLMVK